MRKRLQMMAVALLATAVSAAPAAAYFSGSAARHVVKRPAKATSNRRGRPRKFAGPSRAVTLTLPDDTIAALQTINSDLSRAIVAAVQTLEPQSTPRQVQLATFGATAVIVVPDSHVLRDRTGVELVPISDGRALLSFDERTTVPQLELRVLDTLADGTLAEGDKVMFEQLAEILRDARRAGGIEMRQRSVLVMRHKNGVDTAMADPAAVAAERRRA